MLETKLKGEIDRLRDRFWSGGISNPMTAIEQISYLIFMKRLEDMDDHEKRMAARRDEKYRSVFKGHENCRWSSWINMPAEEMLEHVRDKIFPFIKNLKGDESLFGETMKDAIFMIPKASLLQETVKIVDSLNIAEQNQDTQGDLYEYLLSKLNTAGENGQFRTPRHIIRMMVELVNPRLGETVLDPASGTAGFLVGAYQYILKENTSPDVLEYDEDGVPRHLVGDKITKKSDRAFLKEKTLHGLDFDTTMVRFGMMNLVLHGIPHPDVRYSDTLSKAFEVADRYEVVLANPPFKGSIDKSDISDQLPKNTKKTELLFIHLMIRVLVMGGRCGVIVPDGVLFGSSTAHKELRKKLIDENQLDAVISLPSGVFRPYAGVSTAILIFTKGGTTENVFYYDVVGDGYSLDDKRDPRPNENDLPDLIAKWQQREKLKAPEKGAKWFRISKKEIAANDYDLSVSRYKPIVYEEVKYDPPKKIIDRLIATEREIQTELEELRGMLG